MDYPLKVEGKGVKINPNAMEKEKLYHCNFNDNILLMYMNNQDLLNCFEISDKELVSRVLSANQDVDVILENYIKENNLGKN